MMGGGRNPAPAAGYRGLYGGARYNDPYQQQAYYAPGEPMAGAVQRGINPIYLRHEVAYDGPQRPGTIVIDTPNKFLYLVQPSSRAIRYGIGVGRPGFMWSGVKQVSRKAEWPGWTRRIHGTNEPNTIGQNVSSGCIRMMNEDVTDLYGRVGIGTKVVVM